ncbi:acyl-CoA dehydrogenase [Xylogone sp. PMI_703]|nr:acyl-CoA dehydrogenase [Xylogone sp. PMI_703]
MPTVPTIVQPKPASADSGFMLSPPPAQNVFISDVFLQRILAWYLPSETFKAAKPQLIKLGEEAISDEIKKWNVNAEKQPPYIKTHNVWGVQLDFDNLVTTEGWRELGKWGARSGVVALGYEPGFENYKRIVQYACNYIWAPSSGLYSCPVGMTDGAACLLSHVLPTLPSQHPFHEAFQRLISRSDNWTSGQWMTERAGGSDVQNTETWAKFSPLPNKVGQYGRLDEGDFIVSGFKFFSSATDANMAIFLAKTESGKLSTFLAPLRKTIIDASGKEKTVTNGVRIHRLKNKLGTKQVPTAELELKEMRAHLVGPLDQGVRTISHILNISRIHSFIDSAGGWRRAMSIAKSFAQARTTLDQPLWTLPLHLRTLAECELKHRGLLHLSFFTVALLGFTESKFPEEAIKYAPLPHPGSETEVVLRALTATAKAVVGKNAVLGIQECMEAIGGVGYLDDPDEWEYNVAGILRDTSVNTIWEGTTNVLSSELVRHLLKKNNLEIFGGWFIRAVGAVENNLYRRALDRAWQSIHRELVNRKDGIPGALANGRRIMFSLAWVVSGLLLASDAQRDEDGVANEIARRWILDGEVSVGEWLLPGVGGMDPNAKLQEAEERAKWDCRIVWGVELPENASTGRIVRRGPKI